ncbi:MAG TPA: response regulator [Armatimonadota bacterium]|nr:response regulator [Armatimonadota bacterium]
MHERGVVLLVDDNRGIRLTMGRILGNVGYRVVVAANGSEAVDVARRQPFDVALIDFKMNGMNGAETCASLRQFNLDATLFIVTAHVSSEIERSALADGATGVIHKPVDVPALLELLNELITPTEGALVPAVGRAAG